ncbi:MAG: hypothetical protein V3T77_08820, partial [Planctomycetota bacterium]
LLQAGSPASLAPKILRTLPERLKSVDQPTRAEADQQVVQLLIDPQGSRHGLEVGRGLMRTPYEWFQNGGAETIFLALLGRFQTGVSVDKADQLLTALGNAYPKSRVLSYGSVTLPDRWPTESPPLLVVRALVNPEDPRGPYFLYRMERSHHAPGAVLGLALLRALSQEAAPHLRKKMIALLRRVPDQRLVKLLQKRYPPGTAVPDSPAWRELLQNRIGFQHSFQSLGPWIRSKDLRRQRHQYLRQELKSRDEGRVLQALDRIRWDPDPDLDSTLVNLAEMSDYFLVRQAALLALRAVPTRRGFSLLRRSLANPRLREASFTVIHHWLGEDAAGYAGHWEVILSPSRHQEAMERVLVHCQTLEALGDVAALSDALQEQRHLVTVYQMIPTLALRGELRRDWYRANGPALVRGMESPVAEVRAGTIYAFLPWETPAVIPILAERLLEENLFQVTRACLDGIFELGKPENAAEVFAVIAESRKYRGLEIAEAYALLFPEEDFLSPLITLSQSSEAEQRAAAAYLMAALPRSSKANETLLELLYDAAQPVRFWANQSLKRRFGADMGYLPELGPTDNLNAIRKWRQHAEATFQNPPH